jgi:hypothetical protein
MTGNKAVRLFAWVPTGYDRSKVVHTTGLPTDHSGQAALPPAALLVLDQLEDEKAFYLIRYSAEGEFAGDTWHENLDDAKHQAEFEFGNLAWELGQSGTKDHDFARAKLAERKTT